MQQPRTAMLRVEIREGCYFAYYRDYIPPPPEITSSHSGTVQRVDAVKNANRIDTIIGYGNIPVTNLKGPAQGVWVDLTTGGGRVRIDVQFSEFVDPQIL